MIKRSEKQSISGSSKIRRRNKRNRQRGNNYEVKLVNELKEITGNENLCTSRSESKNLDNCKIDICDPDNVLDFYLQAKCTQAIPQIKKINNEVGKKDKPLVIMWNAQELREKNQVSVGEYAIMPKELFYQLLITQY